MARRVSEKLDSEALWNYAQRLVGGRAMTIAELKAKLTPRAANEQDVSSTLSRLKELRALNDRQFADSYAAGRRDGAGHGKARVLRDLALRQVPRLVAESAAEEAFRDVDEVEHALAYLRRKIRVPDPDTYFSDPRRMQAAFRRLRYNGFSARAAMGAIRRVSAGAPEIEDEPEEQD